MSIDLTPETEHLVREEIRSGHFRSVDELIVCGVHAWREKNGSTAASLATLNSEAMLEIDGLWVHQGQADPDADWNGIISNVSEERISDFTRFSGSGVFFPIHQFWWRLPSAAIRTTSNIFGSDIGMATSEQELLAAKLILQIYRTIKERKLTQAQAGEILGTKQPQVSKLMRGNRRVFS